MQQAKVTISYIDSVNSDINKAVNIIQVDDDVTVNDVLIGVFDCSRSVDGQFLISGGHAIRHSHVVSVDVKIL